MDYLPYITGALGAFIIAFLTYRDAKSRGMNAFAWSIGVFLLLIVFLPLYFIIRKPKLSAYAQKDNEVNIINGILAVAIAILFYLHFSSINTGINREKTQNPSIYISSFSGIVYLNVDSVLQEYDMYYEFKNSLEAKQKKLEAEFNAKSKAWERDAADFQDKAQKGLLLRSQAEDMQQKLAEEQQNLLALRDQMTYELAEEEQVMNRQLIHSIMEYLKEYNQQYNYQYILGTSFGGNILYANDSLNITREVLKGLNEKYVKQKAEENK